MAIERTGLSKPVGRPYLVAPTLLLVVLVAILSTAAAASRQASVPQKIGSCDANGALVAVLPHYQSPFTHQFVVGAQAAAAQCNAKVTSTAPSKIDPPTQLRDFQDLLSRGVKAIVTVAYPANLWIAPINRAVGQGVQVGTVDVASPKSSELVMAAPREVDFGAALGRATAKALGPGAKGTIVVGICFPSLDVLQERVHGFASAMKAAEPGVTIVGPENTTFTPAQNYLTWQRLTQKYPDALAFAGVCDGDVDNLLKVKSHASGAKWLIAGENLDPVSLQGIASGEVAALVGAQPFMQGYVAMRTLLMKFAGKAVTRGWIDTGIETVTKANVGVITRRENSVPNGYQQSLQYYWPQISKIYANLGSSIKPFSKYVAP